MTNKINALITERDAHVQRARELGREIEKAQKHCPHKNTKTIADANSIFWCDNDSICMDCGKVW